MGKMIETGRLTVGLPIYNEEKTIRKTLDSIMENIDEIDYVFISDNDSTDATSDICKEYCQLDSRIKYYKNDENIGSWQNMMKLLQRINTEFYMQLGGHDYLSSGYIVALKKEMSEDTVCCFGNVVNQIPNSPVKDTYWNCRKSLASDQVSKRFLSYLSVGGANRAYYGIMRTSALKEAVEYLGNYRGLAMDNLVVANMSLKGKLKYIPEARIVIMSRNKDKKEVYRHYRKCGMYVPYINPQRHIYQYIMQMVDANDELKEKKSEIEKIIKRIYNAYPNTWEWLKENYDDIC